MAGTVSVGCKLPHGIIITHPMNPSKKVTIEGLNSAKIPQSTFMVTQVDADLWSLWKDVYKDYPALKSRAIFEAKSESEALSMGKDLTKVKTGFEPLDPNAHGVQPEAKPARR